MAKVRWTSKTEGPGKIEEQGKTNTAQRGQVWQSVEPH